LKFITIQGIEPYKMISKRSKLTLIASLGAALSGCNLLTLLADPGPASEIPDGQRLIIGELLTPREGDFGGAENQGMTLAALVGDPGTDPEALHVGVPFNPAQTSAVGGDRVSFQLLLPSDKDAVLFFQTTPAAGAGDRFGVFLASLSFATDATGESQSARIPAGEETIDLGLVRIDALNEATNQDNLALPEENPLAQVDSDNDGTDNAADIDDDNDGLIDLEDDFDDNINNDGLSDEALEGFLQAIAGQ
jgi:hypothetical protein